MGRLLWFIIIVAGIYFIFFKPKKAKEYKTNESNSEDNLVEMVECAQCKAYISNNDAIIKDNKYYCSIDCLSRAIKA